MTQAAIKLKVRQPTQARGERSVAAIRRAATELVDHQDVDSLTVADIARGAGVGVGTFYHYYPSKESLFLDLRNQLFAETGATLAGAFDLRMETPEEFIAGLERLVLGFVEVVAKRHRLELAILSISYAHPEVALILREQEQPVKQLVAALLTQYAKVLRPREPEPAAEAIVLLIGSLIGQTIRDPHLRQHPESLVHEAVQMVAHYLLTDAQLAGERSDAPADEEAP